MPANKFIALSLLSTLTICLSSAAFATTSVGISLMNDAGGAYTNGSYVISNVTFTDDTPTHSPASTWNNKRLFNLQATPSMLLENDAFANLQSVAVNFKVTFIPYANSPQPYSATFHYHFGHYDFHGEAVRISGSSHINLAFYAYGGSCKYGGPAVTFKIYNTQ